MKTQDQAQRERELSRVMLVVKALFRDEYSRNMNPSELREATLIAGERLAEMWDVTDTKPDTEEDIDDETTIDVAEDTYNDIWGG